MSLKPISISENSIRFPLLNVNWNKHDCSPVVFSYDEPPNVEVTFCEKFMAFYYLHVDIQKWFTEINARFALGWDEERKIWILDIFDKHIAMFFKLVWSDTKFFNGGTI